MNMADYHTPTVIEPVIPLTAMLPIERLFLARVFSEENDEDTVYFYSVEGASDLIRLDVGAVRAALDAGSAETSRLIKHLLEHYDEAISGDDEIELEMCGDLWADVLQDIVRRSPELDHLTVTMAYTCTKMRPDGFGGLAMLITANSIRWESTSTLFDRFYTEAAANGEIDHGHT
jgi:hypothetical protein